MMGKVPAALVTLLALTLFLPVASAERTEEADESEENRDPWWLGGLIAATQGTLDPQDLGRVPGETEAVQDPDGKKKKRNKKEDRRGGIVVAPIPMVNPTIGNGLALVGLYTFRPNKKDTVSPPSTIGAAGFYTDTESWGAGAGAKFYLGEDRWRLAGGFAHFDVNYDFYGIGNDAGDRGKFIRVFQVGNVWLAEGLRKVWKSWHAGLRFQHIVTNTKLGLSEPDEFEPSNPIQILPSDFDFPEFDIDLTLVSLGAHIQRDTRDTKFAPLSGSLLDVRADFYSDAFGSRLNYRRYPVEFSYYLSVREDDVLAMDFNACDVEGRAPFFALCLLGQGTKFRGYTGGRYRDRTLISAVSEYRWQFRPRIGFVGFAGFAQVAPSFSEYTADNWLPSAGLGFRWMASKDNRINLSVDYGWGHGDSALYMYVGEAF